MLLVILSNCTPCDRTDLLDGRICAKAPPDMLGPAEKAAAAAFKAATDLHPELKGCIDNVDGIELWIGGMQDSTCPMPWQRGHRACYYNREAWVDMDLDMCWLQKAVGHEMLHMIADACFGTSSCSAEQDEGDMPFCRTAQCTNERDLRSELRMYHMLGCD